MNEQGQTQGVDLGTQYLREAEFALARHATRLSEAPKRVTTTYLRAALGSVREVGILSRYQPHLLGTAHRLLARLVAVAREAEATCFAAGGNSAPYIALLVTCETWRLRLLSLAAHGQPREQPTTAPLPPLGPLAAAMPPPDAAASPRRFVPTDQGGRHKDSGHATGPAR